MVGKKPRIVIIGAGMAGLTAANKLYTSVGSKEVFELCVVEGGTRIGGRINTSEFGGDRIEMGATWIHGIIGSPVHKIAQEINSLESEQPWECMDGSLDDESLTIAEGGYELNPSLVNPVSCFFKKLMDFAQGKPPNDDDQDSSSSITCSSNEEEEEEEEEEAEYYYKLAMAAKASSKICCTSSTGTGTGTGIGKLSIGSFLRQGLDAYWGSTTKDRDEQEEEVLRGEYGSWSRNSIEEAVFAMHENIQRTYTSAGDLLTLDYNAESEYRMFPGEEITIAKGYKSIIESLASVLPAGSIQLGRKVTRIEWQPQHEHQPEEEDDDDDDDGGQQQLLLEMENGGHAAAAATATGTTNTRRSVKLHFCDGSVMLADHVIVTVSLGVLKAGIRQDSGMFDPPLPPFKTRAISRLGFGVVNKLFLQLGAPNHDHDHDHDRDRESSHNCKRHFPFLQMAFHRSDSEFRNPKIPWWFRKTASLCPIYGKSSVLLSWFAGKEALELESLNDEEIIHGVSTTISSFLSKNSQTQLLNSNNSHSHDELLSCNGNNVNSSEGMRAINFTKVLRTKWGTDPLFMGSYSYVAVGSSGEDLDTMAEPLPQNTTTSSPPLQILFAGEATHRTHYSTTHGAYFSGLREANRLLQHYQSLWE